MATATIPSMGGEGNDTLRGGSGNDILTGGGGNDSISGGNGNDTLIGGAGIDTLSGGAGDDVFILNVGDESDVISDSDAQTLGNAGFDVIKSSISVRLRKEALIEVVELQGNQAIDAYGDLNNDSLVGGAGINLLSGGAGNDTLIAVGAGDTLQGGDGNDLLVAGSGATSSQGGAGSDTLLSGGGIDYLEGGSDNDSLIGGAEADTLAGGIGDDFYVFNSDANVIQEAANSGFDTVQYSLLFSSKSKQSLAAGVEGAVINTQAYFELEGNELSNRLDGNGLENVISGLAGNDTIYGNAGADIISGGDGNDALNGGDDSDKLTGEFGNDSLNGESGDDLLQGGIGDDSLYGGDGNDTLNGGQGSDLLAGGVGNDVYTLAKGDGSDYIAEKDFVAGNVDTVTWSDVTSSDVVSITRDYFGSLYIANRFGDELSVASHFEDNGSRAVERFVFSDGVVWRDADVRAKVVYLGGEGNDALYGFDGYANRIFGNGGADAIYGAKLNDVLSGGNGNDSLNGLAGNDSLTGDDGNDLLVGDLGNDTLVGGTGIDTLQGGAGDDQYYIDSASDVVVELVGGGNDSVRGTVSYTTPDNIEVASLQGTADLNLNGQANVRTRLNGNAGNNRITGGTQGDGLYGGAGLDTLVGGDGSDVYFLFDDDVVIESANGTGVDAVVSLLEHTNLADNIEYLKLTDYALSANGSGDDNLIFANDNGNEIDGRGGDDQLFGGKGADTLSGGLGDDTLMGNLGDDVYRYNRGEGLDTIVDTDATVGNSDTLVFSSISNSQLWFTRSGDDLLINVVGSTSGVAIGDWYLGADHQVEQLAAGGKTLTNARVQGLVDAMSTLTPPPLGQSTLSAAYQSSLNTALAQAWQ